MPLFSSSSRLLKYIAFAMALVLLILTVYRFIFFEHYNSLHKPFSGSTFLMGFRFDLRVAAVLGLIMLLKGSWRFLSPFRSGGTLKMWNIGLAVMFTLILLVCVADFYHYDYLKERLNASVMNYADDAAISAEMMWQTYPVWQFLLGLLVAGIAFYFLLRAYSKRLLKAPAAIKDRNRIRNIAAFLIPFLILGLSIFGRLGQYPLRWSDAFGLGNQFKAVVSLNPFQSFFSTLNFRSSSFDKEKIKWALPLVASDLGTHLQPGDSPLKRSFAYDTATKHNVVLVICESFAAPKTSSLNNGLDPTPFFKTMSDNGLFFSRCFSPSLGTARGIWAIITGVPDVQDPETASRNPAMVNQHTIINDYTGYERFYFLGGSTTWANIRGLIKNNIDSLQIYEQENFQAERVDVWGISDHNLFLESNKILAQQKRPFFAVIQTADNHRPYTIPEVDLKEFKKKELPEDTLRKYGFESVPQYNAFRYADFCIQKFMEAAQKEAYYKNTIFVFVGDHGFSSPAGPEFPKSFTETKLTSNHVPLLFYAPGIVSPARYDYPASQIDILPTLASMMKQAHTNTTLGKDLLDTTINHSSCFITEPGNLQRGIFEPPYFYQYNTLQKQGKLYSVINNDPVQLTDSLRTYFQRKTDAWFYASQYMLLNNKKP